MAEAAKIYNAWATQYTGSGAYAIREAQRAFAPAPVTVKPPVSAPVTVKPPVSAPVVSTAKPEAVPTVARAPIPFEGPRVPTVRDYYARQVDAGFVPGGSPLAASQARADAAQARAAGAARGNTNRAVGFPGGGQFPGQGAGVSGGFPGQGVGVGGSQGGGAVGPKRKKQPGELPGPEDGDDIEPGSVTDKVVKAITSTPALVSGAGYGLYTLAKFL